VGRRDLRGQRWGVLGGVFDPVHYAHLAIAEQTREALDLAGVLFIPVGDPSHRAAPHAAAGHRSAMVELAIGDNPTFELSRLETDRPGRSYSLDTMQRLAAERPDDEFVLILSAESASYLPEWREPELLLDLVEIAVVPRLGYADLSQEWLEARFPGREGRFTFVQTARLGHSSSDVRARLAGGRSVRYLVPPAVDAYIGEHGLYGTADRPRA
jgi:nicotinate-nucleotide adenylyltransferase